MRTLLLTGAGRGLGLATARFLLRRDPGLHLVTAVRGDAEALASRLSADAPGRVTGLTCDLASLDSVRQAAGRLAGLLEADRLPPLRGIVANAGMQATTATQRTADGFEATFGVNVLGHYLLIRLLLDRLTAPARIVLVGSGTHYGDFRHNLGLIPAPRDAPAARLARPWTAPDAATPRAGRAAYATSKLAVVRLTHALDRRTPADVAVYCLDPGMMPGTGLARQGTALERAAWHSVLRLTRVLPGVTSPRAAARRLAAAAIGEAPGPSGSHLAGGRVTRSSPASYDREREEDLWATAARLVGLAQVP
ncbi:SDR family NAD(P)-dependent oxidoreductase [Streptomyces sp. DSM 44917]|uniref:SDR family NAD(P)-dependent oxidoreductase n=1 Tax=Streptomyces boetiae TaxID=3075541 RepID=A0ABU2L5D1_9ACTN|nr:SDR family NAD(P)-dependent oxidoreductase [Streptomyces sp. DSM 44917]MDT0306577.1 SDR family NAD(P)-dependent oxidoreductase [Streptomyces sp. DSM 44917]